MDLDIDQHTSVVLFPTLFVNFIQKFYKSLVAASTDASMMSVLWYPPASFTSIRITLDGFFFGVADNMYHAEFSTAQSRTRDDSALLYQLPAGTTYTYSLLGKLMFSPDASVDFSTVYSLIGDPANFTTGSKLS